MKSSYRIFGLMWDGLPEYEAPVVELSQSEVSHRLGTPRNLFELDHLSRSVSCSDLLGLEERQELVAKLSDFQECDEIQIDLDDLPDGIGGVPRSFYLHRARQVGGLVQRLVPSATITLVSCPHPKEAA